MRRARWQSRALEVFSLCMGRRGPTGVTCTSTPGTEGVRIARHRLGGVACTPSVGRTRFWRFSQLHLAGEELGGPDLVSANIYATSKGHQLRACEMPDQKALD